MWRRAAEQASPPAAAGPGQLEGGAAGPPLVALGEEGAAAAGAGLAPGKEELAGLGWIG